MSVNLLSKLASLDKLDPVVFRISWVPILVQLWSMSDRSVRTVMLQSLKVLVPYVPDAVVNKSIFDNVLAGFADSNAKLVRRADDISFLLLMSPCVNDTASGCGRAR